MKIDQGGESGGERGIQGEREKGLDARGKDKMGYRWIF
jgi:hypothetical protein